MSTEKYMDFVLRKQKFSFAQIAASTAAFLGKNSPTFNFQKTFLKMITRKLFISCDFTRIFIWIYIFEAMIITSANKQ